MSKRQFPFDGSCPLQLKTHVNTTQFEKSNNMEQIYGKYKVYICFQFVEFETFTSTEMSDFHKDLLIYRLRLTIVSFSVIPAEKTLEALREGMDRYDNGEIEEETVKETVNCQRCRQTKSGLAMTCAFCERKTCGDCRKQCAHCDRMFCSLCSVVK